MANLVVIKNGEFYEAYDADRGVTVFSATNQNVAQSFVDNGVVTPETIQRYSLQDINTQGGVETTPKSPVNTTGTPTTTDPAISGTQIKDETGAVSQFQLNEYGEVYQPVIPPSTSAIKNTSTVPAGQALNEYGDVYTPLPPVPAADIITSNSATAGLTPAQLEALGGADPTDPFIRARLDLPPLGPTQPTLIDALANGLPSVSNALPSLSDIKTGIGNTFASISNLFSSSTPSSVPADQIQAGATVPAGMQLNEYGDAYTPLPPVPLSEIQTEASTDTDEELVQLAGPSDSEIQTLADTDTDEELVQLAGPSDSEIQLSAAEQDESTYQQLVQAFSEAEVQTEPAPFAPIAALDETPLVPVSQQNDVPTEVPVEQQGDVLVDLNTGQEYPVDPDSPFVETPGGLLVSPDELPVEQQGNELVDLNTGQVLAIDENGFTDQGGLNVLPEDIPVQEQDGTLVDLNTGEVLGIDENGFTESSTGLNVLPEDVPNLEAEDQELVPLNDVAREPGSYTPEELDAIANAQGVSQGEPDIEVGTTEAQLYDQENEAQTQAFKNQAQQQQTIASQRRQINNGDWRVRLRLAPGSKYLYNASPPGPLLEPLAVTDGVIFPYTPAINTTYKANYSPYDLTHSNYRGYFYSNSYVESINISAMFTAQSTAEANYLLAVITFFKSVTKMFYGQDAERGSPPPLVYLSGLGQYQFNENPCLVQSFTYNLPADVDYVRAGSPDQRGVNLAQQRDRQSVSTNNVFGSLNRLASAFLTKGAIPNPPAPPTLGLNNPTYVPSKIEIQLSLLPVQSRQQVSQQFSVKNFANGNLIKGGFW